MALVIAAHKSDNQTMKTYLPSRAPCPIARAARVLGDRWVLLILRDAFLGAERFEEFVDRLGINRAALTSRLAILQEAGLILRDPPDHALSGARRKAVTLRFARLAAAPPAIRARSWRATSPLIQPCALAKSCPLRHIPATCWA